MPNYANNIAKVILGNQTLIDLTNDTVNAAHLAYGYTAHGSNGQSITGTLDPGAEVVDDVLVLNNANMYSVANETLTITNPVTSETLYL